jgi:hypothetical protein
VQGGIEVIPQAWLDYFEFYEELNSAPPSVANHA